jgi:hypothetical protein
LFCAILDKASGLIIGRGGEAIKEMVDRRQVFSKVLIIGYIYIYIYICLRKYIKEIHQGDVDRRRMVSNVLNIVI